MLYRIEEISARQGNGETDERDLQRIGREGYILQLERGCPMVFAYTDPYNGALVTSETAYILPEQHGIRVTTQRRVYHLREVEARSPEWPEPVDWEEA